MFWMYSFKLRKVVGLSDPRCFDHILPSLCPEDIPHRIDLSADDICKMHEEDGDKVQRMPVLKSTGFRVLCGWPTTSPHPMFCMFWMYSFKLRKVVGLVLAAGQ
jgi:hypothetical protein